MTHDPIVLSRRFITLSAAAAMLTLVLAGCGPKDAAPGGGEPGPAAVTERPAVNVEVATAALRPITASYNTTAALEAPAEAQVVAKTSGVLLRLLVEEGDQVPAGQVLAKIDPERPRLEVQRAEALLRKLEAELARSSELFERKLIAADLHDKLRYDVETQRAVYRMAQLELSYTDIVAPISGVVAQRMAKVGNLIQLNSPVFRIVDTTRLEATLNVPEREIATMRAGAPVSMTADALPGRVFEGRIARVSPVVDAGSGTFRVVCTFDPDPLLRPGMFGRIAVMFDQRTDVLTVPRVALLEDQGEPAVFLVREGKALRTPVQLGYLSGELVEIRSGLAPGDAVVTTGKVTLRDGAQVQVLNSGPAAADAATDAADTTTEPTSY